MAFLMSILYTQVVILLTWLIIFFNLSFGVDIIFILGSYAGPWFRMSNISYPEIVDVQQAAKGLAGNLI